MYCRIAWAKNLYAAILLLAELLVLLYRLIYHSLESLYHLLVPPIEKSLTNEIVLVINVLYPDKKNV